MGGKKRRINGILKVRGSTSAYIDCEVGLRKDTSKIPSNKFPRVVVRPSYKATAIGRQGNRPNVLGGLDNAYLSLSRSVPK